MAQDVAKGRHSEINYMNGHIACMGRGAGVATPYNDAVIDVMHRIDDGTLKPVASNVDLVLQGAGRR